MLNINYAPASSAFTNISNRLYELKMLSESLYRKCFCQLGDKVLNYLKQMFTILPCIYMNFLLTALKVVSL